MSNRLRDAVTRCNKCFQIMSELSATIYMPSGERSTRLEAVLENDGIHLISHDSGNDGKEIHGNGKGNRSERTPDALPENDQYKLYHQMESQEHAQLMLSALEELQDKLDDLTTKLISNCSSG